MSQNCCESYQYFILLPTTKPIPSSQIKPYISPCANLPISQDEAIKSRYSNFYNGYNIDYHNDGSWWHSKRKDDCHDRPCRAKGRTVDGKSPCCRNKAEVDPCKCINLLIDKLMESSDCHKPKNSCCQSNDNKQNSSCCQKSSDNNKQNSSCCH